MSRGEDMRFWVYLFFFSWRNAILLSLWFITFDLYFVCGLVLYRIFFQLELWGFNIVWIIALEKIVKIYLKLQSTRWFAAWMRSACAWLRCSDSPQCTSPVFCPTLTFSRVHSLMLLLCAQFSRLSCCSDDSEIYDYGYCRQDVRMSYWQRPSSSLICSSIPCFPFEVKPFPLLSRHSQCGFGCIASRRYPASRIDE